MKVLFNYKYSYFELGSFRNLKVILTNFKSLEVLVAADLLQIDVVLGHATHRSI